MDDTAKYLIHATVAADGVVERSDVVGAVFGQTEGLLGEELDLRDLQESSKVGRIDVAIESENGQSFGKVTVASSLDKVETAILGASLETIDRIGPCHASVEVTSIEDVRAAKRREVVERAKELLADGFEETSLASTDVLDEVRDAVRVEGIVEYNGLPAGPRVGDSDAVIIVEGRSDVLTLLEGGIKNAIAVEGTNVPDAVAELTRDRTVTAFLDGDRGGELILRELAQVGDVDYVAFAPAGKSVEDLDRGAVFEALRGKVPYETIAEAHNLRAAVSDSGGSPSTGSGVNSGSTPMNRRTERGEPTDRSDTKSSENAASSSAGDTSDDSDESTTAASTAGTPRSTARSDSNEMSDSANTTDATTGADESDDSVSTDTLESVKSPLSTDEIEESTDPTESHGESAEPTADTESAVLDDEPRSLEEHVQEVVDSDSGLVRLLDDSFGILAEAPAEMAFDTLADATDPPHRVVLDGHIDQRLLDVAAQRGVSEVLGRDVGSFVKRPIGTRIRTIDDLRTDRATPDAARQ